MTIDTNEPTDQPSTEPVEPPPRRSVTLTLPSARSLLRGLAAVIILALVVTVIVESVHIHHLDASRSASSPVQLNAAAGLDATSRSALAAATGYAEAFATYDYRHLAQDFAVTEAHSVDPFLSEYKKETAAIQPNLAKLKSSSTGKVRSAGVVSVGPTTAVVDVFLDQTIVNSAAPKPRLDPQRLTMSLSRVAGQWKITKVDVL